MLAATPAAAPAASGQTGGLAPSVLVVGDSLAVGMVPFLERMLPGVAVTFDARAGRTTPQGLVALRARLRELRPQAVAVSLGTNDGPDPGRFASRIERALTAIPADACVVWADVARPPRKGAFGALNIALRAMARRDRRLRLIAWHRAVTRGAVRLPDHVHPDTAGFRTRSRLYASALAAC